MSDSRPLQKVRGLTPRRLKVIGLLLIAAAAVTSAVLQGGLAPLTAVVGSPDPLDQVDMGNLTLVIVVEAASWAAVPLYAWLLYSGFTHTASVRDYGVRLAFLAVASEVPYDLATSGRFWDMSSQNPVFAVLVGLIVLHFLGRNRDSSGGALMAVVIIVAALIWLVFFNVGLRLGLVPVGVLFLLFTLVFFYLHAKENTMMMVGGLIGAIALVFPAMGFVLLHFRNEDAAPGGQMERRAFYAAYPACLLLAGLARLAA